MGMRNWCWWALRLEAVVFEMVVLRMVRMLRRKMGFLAAWGVQMEQRLPARAVEGAVAAWKTWMALDSPREHLA